jgi:hypothetical protein
MPIAIDVMTESERIDLNHPNRGAAAVPATD